MNSHERKTIFSSGEDEYFDPNHKSRGRTEEYEKPWLNDTSSSPKHAAINSFSPTLASSPYGKGAEGAHSRSLNAKDRIRVVKELDPTKPHNRLRR